MATNSAPEIYFGFNVTSTEMGNNDIAGTVTAGDFPYWIPDNMKTIDGEMTLDVYYTESNRVITETFKVTRTIGLNGRRLTYTASSPDSSIEFITTRNTTTNTTTNAFTYEADKHDITLFGVGTVWTDTTVKTIDWRDQRRVGRLRAYMIPPANLNDYYGELEGVIWSESSFTAGYYTDTRTQGTIVYVGNGWIRNSLIRIVYEIEEWDYSRTLGTYIVTNDSSVRQNGQWKTTLELNSMLYAMDLHKPGQQLIMSQNSTTLAAMEHIFNEDDRAHVYRSPNDTRLATTQVLEGGKSELARLYAVSNLSGNRIDVDGDGNVTVEPYVAPANKTPVMTIDLLDPRGIAYDGLTRSTDWLKQPTEATVIYKYNANTDGVNEQYEITATATVSNTSHASNAARGYTLTDLHSETELSPPTQATAQRLAEKYLKQSVELMEWQLNTKYLPLWEGDVVELMVPDGESEYQGTRKCLVKSIDFTGPYMDATITLKETSSGDDDR